MQARRTGTLDVHNNNKKKDNIMRFDIIIIKKLYGGETEIIPTSL
jgi:hypothetical protein